MIDEFAMTHEKAAAAVGRSRVAVSNLLRLLTLSAHVQDMLMHGKLDMGHARALVGLDGVQQVLMAEQIAYSGLSVREAEGLVKKHNGEHGQEAAKAGSSGVRRVDISQDVLRLQETLSDKLGAAVTIKACANGAGVLKISYASLDQLDGIIAKISR